MTITELKKSNRIIFEATVGSRAYGTYTANSDDDVSGIYASCKDEYLNIFDSPKQINDERNDTTYYNLQRFIELASSANPNIIELLFMPSDCTRFKTNVMDQLILNRELFLSKKCIDSHIGYAMAQVKRAKGRNKWVNSPKPKSSPRKENYCWVILNTGNDKIGSENLPFRPKPLKDLEIDLGFFHCSSLEHCPEVYRLYDYKGEANCQGVFSGEEIVCRNIPIEDEKRRFKGLLIFNGPGYKRAIKDHKNYWEWHDNRNECRWIKQEGGVMDYDAKNMMHTFRLLYSGLSIVKYRCPIVRFDGEKLDFLCQVRDGEFEYGGLIEKSEKLIEDLEEMRSRTRLPDDIDYEKINDLFLELIDMWEKSQ